MRRAYPDWTNTGGYFGSETVTVPSAIEVDVWVSHQLIASGSKPSASLLSFTPIEREDHPMVMTIQFIPQVCLLQAAGDILVLWTVQEGGLLYQPSLLALRPGIR